MSKTNDWLLFAAVQIVGAALPLLAKTHPSAALTYAGLFLLLPGDLIVSVAGTLNPFIFYPAVFLINAGVWVGVKKMMMPNTVP
jgi:hypothetical protein